MRDNLRRSRRQEQRIADENGGQRTPQSGAGWRVKNDVRTGTESWELKTTTYAQFTLKEEDIFAAWTHAVQDRRRMVFGIEFGSGRRVVVLDHDDYIELRDRAGG